MAIKRQLAIEHYLEIDSDRVINKKGTFIKNSIKASITIIATEIISSDIDCKQDAHCRDIKDDEDDSVVCGKKIASPPKIKEEK